MNWWETLIVALSTYATTKSVDFAISLFSEKREFKKQKRGHTFAELEELKNEIGACYELAANWKGYEVKQSTYASLFEGDYKLIGRFSKYPSIANAARDVMHWSMIVASCEKSCSDDLEQNKKDLHTKHKAFLKACEDYLNDLA